MIRTIAIRQPLVAPCAALALGIAAAQWARFSFLETLISTLLLAGLAGLGLRFAPRAAIAACLAGFLVAGVMIGSRPHPPDPLRVDRLLGADAGPLDDPVRLRGWVREPPEVFEDAERFVLEVESVFAATPARGAIGSRPIGGPTSQCFGSATESGWSSSRARVSFAISRTPGASTVSGI